ncbi:MAG TPA: DUF6600 domain-containing protein [Verrucomicrobiae bacterium]|nr:DUF6600 domain-containing protein [Verrucomicrobiae bacterium]
MKKKNLLAIVATLLLPLCLGRAQVPVTDASVAQPPGPAAVPTDLSPTVNEVVRLSEAGTTEDVILAYIQNANSPFNLSADQILYLRDIGISSPVLAGMLNRDNALRNQTAQYSYNQTLYPPSAPPPASPPPADNEAVAPQQVAPVPEAPAPVAVPVSAPVYVSSPPPDVTYFYNDLAPYGTWVDLDGVGWCWQPRAVRINAGWRPYCDSGHWDYTDAGWYWQSDYSWGWAPFHYGRWYMHPGCGWVWSPDRVWGPAWVVWRSEGDACGWAPLPPHADFDLHLGWRFNGARVGADFGFGLGPANFTFVALRDFNDRDLGHRRLAQADVTRIYNHTTIINNYTVVNNTIVNNGLKVDRIAAATHTQIHKLPIRDVPAPAQRGLQRNLSGKSELAVYRPPLKAPPVQTPRMVAQKIDQRHPVIQHAPVAPAMTTYRAAPAGNNATPWATPIRNQPRSGSAQPPAGNPARSAPRSAQAQPAPTFAAPSSRPSEQAQSVPRSTSSYQSRQGSTYPAAPNRQTQTLTSPRYTSSARPQEPGNLYPLRSSSRSEVATQAQRSAPAQSAYFPKGYHQAAEVRSIPPANAPQSLPPREPRNQQPPQSR